MNTYRTNAIVAGVLYIVGTVSGVLSMVLSEPLRAAGDPLVIAAANGNQVTIAALCVLLMCLSLAMVPVVLYPVLKRHSEVLAIGYIVFRGALETLTGMIVPVAWLLLIGMGRSSVGAGASAPAGLQGAGALLLQAGGGTPFLAIIFCLGAVMFYAVLYRSRLVPRWITVWGLAAVLPYLAAEPLKGFGLLDPLSSAATLLFIPMLVQEMVLAVWLIAKGFNPTVTAARPAQAATNELLRAA